MRISALCTAVVMYVVMSHPPPAVAQVDQQRAQEYFKEARALCERDGGRLWGVSICAPMVIGDARTQTFATSQPPPHARRPQLIGLVNGPIQWGDTMWAALAWDTIANWHERPGHAAGLRAAEEQREQQRQARIAEFGSSREPRALAFIGRAAGFVACACSATTRGIGTVRHPRVSPR